MGRYDKYKKAVKEELAFKEEQEKLHQKHDHIDEDTVIIEKSNMVKFLLNFLRITLRTLFGVVTIVLTAIGVLTLLYPTTRNAFIDVLEQIFQNVSELL